MSEPFQGPTDGAWTMEQLLGAEMAEVRLKFLPFCGHTPPSSAEIGALVFSQWYSHDFVCGGVPSIKINVLPTKAELGSTSMA